MSDNKYIFEIDKINYSYIDGGKKRIIINDLSYQFKKGTFYTI